MSGIARPALVLGLAGVLPFVWGGATVLSPGLEGWGQAIVGPRLVGQPALIAYGSVILSFMSGVLWGFAARGAEARWTGYAASVLPALWVFFMVGGGPENALSALLAGFVALFALDVQFALWGLVPGWWVRFRALLTALVLPCLAVGLWLG
jgi:hypothetical protein